MYDDFLKIIKYLKSDEELNRLLYYPPEDLGNAVLDPLDSSLPAIMSMNVEQRAGIINKRIMKSTKYKDLEKDSICRIYVYAGRRNPNSNYQSADELFCQSRLVGIGQMDFVGARQINAPYEYTGYQVAFTYSTFKK
jgi:hypothetical protein